MSYETAIYRTVNVMRAVADMEQAATEDMRNDDQTHTIQAIVKVISSTGLDCSLATALAELVDVDEVIEHYTQGHYLRVDVDDYRWQWHADTMSDADDR